MRSQWLMRPAAHASQTGAMPRATQLRTGTIATRVPSSSSPTTSCPGVNGNDTIGSNQREEVPSIVARSDPQMPASRGRTRTHSGPGSSGGSTSRKARGPTRAPPPGESRPATMAAANLAGCREKTSAFIGCVRWSRPCRPAGGEDGPTPGRWGAGAGPPRPTCRSARRASPACGPARPAGSRG